MKNPLHFVSIMQNNMTLWYKKISCHWDEGIFQLRLI